MSKLMLPKSYKSTLDIQRTELGIKLIKDFFEQNLSTELKLHRVTAPLFVRKGLGLNDDLNGTEKPVSFRVHALGDAEVEVVHSLAKWKRMALAEYGIRIGYGIYADMNAIRGDEQLDNLHSVYVDQWDWEAVIARPQRNLEFLYKMVRRIYSAILRTEYFTCENYPELRPFLPPDIHIVHSQDLLNMYPSLPPKDREREICRKYGAVFIVGIGARLSDGKKHDGRAPDYDDWSTCTGDGRYGLNGDILVWYPVLDCAVEISSMGIRVDSDALLRQLDMEGCPGRSRFYFHRSLLEGRLPLSIGGGIGQSRLCMLLLHKAHIGETQASVWPDDMREECEAAGIHLF